MGKDKFSLRVIDQQFGDFSFVTTHYRSYRKGKCPTVFITPIFGGFDLVESLLARLLNLSGMHVFITDFMPRLNLREQIPDLDIHDKTYLKSLLGLEKLIEHCENLPHVDMERLGLFGMSLGGIFSSLMTKVMPQFKATVIIAGGGHHHEILADSKQPIMRLLKKLRMDYFNLTRDEDYKTLMAAHNEMDSLKVFRKKARKDVLMFISTNDDQVPTKVQVETWNDLGQPEAVFMASPHYQMITIVPFMHFKKIRDFFLDRFNPGGEAGVRNH